MNVHPIPHAIQIYSNFPLLFSVMKDKSPVFFSSKLRSFRTFKWLGEKSPNSSYHIWNHKLVFLQILAWLFSVMWHNSSTFSSKSLYVLDKRVQSNSKISHFRVLAWKLIKFYMPFFKPLVSFPSIFATPFSVMTHDFPEIFKLKHYMLWTKRAHQCKMFWTFGCSNGKSLNSSCHYWNNKVRVYSNFALLFSLTKGNSAVFFLAQTSYTLSKVGNVWAKNLHRCYV